MVSLHRTSRYVLICFTRLMHFLCCNLFVMSYLTLSVISANILEIRLPSLSITLYRWLTPSQIPCNPLATAISENVLKIRVSYPAGSLFCEYFIHLTRLDRALHGRLWLFQRILRMFSKLTQPFAIHGTLVLLTTKHHDILIIVWGRGALAKAKGGAKRRV